MAYSTFAYTLTDNIARVHLDRPQKRNCMTLEFWYEMGQVFREIDADGAARVAVITSEGPHFTAGIDLQLFARVLQAGSGVEEGRRRERLRRQVLYLQESFQAISRCRVPVLAAIQGGCIGGGVDLVTACDMRYATADAFFVVREIHLGMAADLGTLQRLPRLMPRGLARELAYTGRQMPADEAKACGFVNSVFADQEEMNRAVFKIASRIAGHSPLAIAGTKEMLDYAEDHSDADGLRYMAAWQMGMLLGVEDLMEAHVASTEQRPPQYRDLISDLDLQPSAPSVASEDE